MNLTVNGRQGQASTSGQGSASSASATSQTATAATDATQAAAATRVRASDALAQARAAMQSAQAQIAAQAHATLTKTNTSTTQPNQITRAVDIMAAAHASLAAAQAIHIAQPTQDTTSDGLSLNGLLPGASQGEFTVLTPTPVQNGSITLAADTAITIPASSTGNQTVTVGSLGEGTVGTVTTYHSGVAGASGATTITPITAGVPLVLSPGSVVSIAHTQTNGEKVTFTGGNTSTLPSSFVTYDVSHLPASWNLPRVSSGGQSVASQFANGGGLTEAIFGTGADAKYTDTLTQTTQQIYLDWQSFNVGANTTLSFDQSQGGSNVGNWLVINHVAADVRPSWVLGAIEAPGQVYVVNENGIIFTGTSQVNAHNITASALKINTTLSGDEKTAGLGLLNNASLTTGQTFLFDSTTSTTTPSSAASEVLVQPGATLEAPTNDSNAGGRVALIGQQVENQGTITTEDGQTILAAGNQVGLFAHNQNDASLRGLDVQIGQVTNSSASLGSSDDAVAINSGTIWAPRADITLAGQSVVQQGLIHSESSVSLNGRIDLLADYNSAVQNTPGGNILSPKYSGTVTLASNSLTEILPDSSAESAVGSQIAIGSLIDIQGKSITLGGGVDREKSTTNDATVDYGAVIYAPGASVVDPVNKPVYAEAEETSNTTSFVQDTLTSGVNLRAGVWLNLNDANASPAPNKSKDYYSFNYIQNAKDPNKLTNEGNQIYLDAGSVIDVSGSSDVSASVLENLVSAQLRAAELANSPLQRSSPLRGKTVQIDIDQFGTYNGVNWIGSPIGDLSGYAALVQRTAQELTVNGGTISLQAGDSVVMRSGSRVDVSGGWINYAGANIATTQVISDGQLLDISQATPDRNYDAIATTYNLISTKWGVNESFGSAKLKQSYQEGYVQGGNAGSVTITAPAVALDGDFRASTVAGANQRYLPSSLATSFGSTSGLGVIQSIYAIPTAGSFNLNIQTTDVVQQSDGTFNAVSYSPYTPAITLKNGDSSSLLGSLDVAFDNANGTLTSDRQSSIILPTTWFAAAGNTAFASGGFGRITINNSLDAYNPSIASGSNNPTITSTTQASINVASDVNLNLGALGRANFTAANIAINQGARLTANGGTLSFTATNYSSFSQNAAIKDGNELFTITQVQNNRGNLTIGPDVTLDTSGAMVDDRVTSPTATTLPLATKGGSITLAGTRTEVLDGSVLNVSGGAETTSGNKLSYGKAGSVSIAGGNSGSDPVTYLALDQSMASALTLNAQIYGYAGLGAGSGTLNITAPIVQIGGDQLPQNQLAANTLWLNPTDADGNVVGASDGQQSGLFAGGFSTIGISSYLNLDIASATGGQSTIFHPVAQVWLPAARSSSLIASTHTSTLLTSQRNPVALSLTTLGAKATTINKIYTLGDLTVGAGSTLAVDPRGNIILNATGHLSIQGTVQALGGKITVEETSSDKDNVGSVLDSETVIDIASSSILDVSGTINPVYTALDSKAATVLDGGTITVFDSFGNTLIEGGAELLANGFDATVDVPSTQSGQTSRLAYVPQEMASNGGTINLTGARGLYVAYDPNTVHGSALLSGKAGNNGGSLQGAGGTLNLTSGIFTLSESIDHATPVFFLSQSSVGTYTRGTGGYFAVDALAKGGFDSFSVTASQGAAVKFVGSNVSLNLPGTITLANNGVLLAGGNVNLSAADITIGQIPTTTQTLSNLRDPSQTVHTSSPLANSSGTIDPLMGDTSKTLTINASQLVDVGNLVTQGISNVNITGGDIRGNGTLDVPGTINLTAREIYPQTESIFAISAFGPDGSLNGGTVNIQSTGGTPYVPFSAGGELDVYATTINQGGNLRAPLGSINLGLQNISSSLTYDAITGQSFPTSTNITLKSDSLTSVSALEPDGAAAVIPYGYTDGTTWFDPSGTDITQELPVKSITITATSDIKDQTGSNIDISGGGDLYASHFVSGTGGTANILATGAASDSVGASAGFAVIPNYSDEFDYASASNSSAGLAVGDRIYLNGGSGLPAGFYTLLPASYALLPGAYLVTPQTSTLPQGTITKPDGSSLVGGYRENAFTSQTSKPLLSTFEIAPGSVVRNRAQYDDSYASSFLTQNALNNNATVPRRPVDAGQVIFNASGNLEFQGKLQATFDSASSLNALGGLVDISSSEAIFITNNASANFNGLVLGIGDPDDPKSGGLDNLNAGSLLIGGYRTIDSAGTHVHVAETHTLTLSNSTSDPLTGSDIILVSQGGIQLSSGSSLEDTGSVTSHAPKLIFDANVDGNALDSSLLRVSSDPSAQYERLGNGGTGQSRLSMGDNGTIVGPSVTLDSTGLTSIGSNLKLTAPNVASVQSLNLGSQQISLQLNNDTNTVSPSSTSLILPDSFITSLPSSLKKLSLLSYQSIDIFGHGNIGSSTLDTLALQAPEIRGYDLSDPTPGATLDSSNSVQITAANVTLDNAAGSGSLASDPVDPGTATGTLVINAQTLNLGGGTGANTIAVKGYDNMVANATHSIFIVKSQAIAADTTATGDTASTQGQATLSLGSANFTVNAPLITGATGSYQTITTRGSISLNASGTSSDNAALGGYLALQGSTITQTSEIIEHSGTVSLDATSGDLSVGGTIDVSNQSEAFHDLRKSPDAGVITLKSSQNVTLTSTASLNLGATGTATNGAAANAGKVQITAGNQFRFNPASIVGANGGTGGTLSLNVGSLSANDSLTALENLMANFTQAQTIRVQGVGTNSDGSAGGADVLIESGTTITTHSFSLSTDRGSITVQGEINAAGTTGGSINLTAFNQVVIQGATITVAARQFDSAGKGGSITLESGSTTFDKNGNVITPPNSDLQTVVIDSNSTLDLSVAANNSSAEQAQANLFYPTASADQASQLLGHFEGTLHIREQLSTLQNQSNSLQGTITGASSILLEGYNRYSATDGSIDNQKNQISADRHQFAGLSASQLSKLFNGNVNAQAVTVAAFGAEIDNPTGDLTLASDWDLSMYRFGSQNAPGVLTIRAEGNLVFNGSLSDGFDASTNLYQAPLSKQVATLPANLQSWSYNLTAGADLSAADVHQVQDYTGTPGDLNPASGSLELGQFFSGTVTGGTTALTSTVASTYYQVFRTGTGDINIATQGDVQLRNQFATIYTAGVQSQAIDPTLFVTPSFYRYDHAINDTSSLGVHQSKPTYAAYYGVAGGNVDINAQGSVEHVTQEFDAFGNPVLDANNNPIITMDSEKQLPSNWLYRRSYTDSNGNFAPTGNSYSETGPSSKPTLKLLQINGLPADLGQTTWWTDFSNFFEGVGTLSGGNVTLHAGVDVSNVDAVVATNARMASPKPNASKLLELGGGNLQVAAGRNIDGGVYYVEKGLGDLSAGYQVVTNSTRSATTIGSSLASSYTSWMPTTLFLGKGNISVTASDNVTIGPVSNPFLLPSGISNTYWDEAYFSTYASTDQVNITSVTGNASLAPSAVMADSSMQTTDIHQGSNTPYLYFWINNVLSQGNSDAPWALSQPWLRLNNVNQNLLNSFSNNGSSYAGVLSLMPASLNITAFSGDIDTFGTVSLSSSPTGTLNLLAAGSINALEMSASGIQLKDSSKPVNFYDSTSINVSDASSIDLPSLTNVIFIQDATLASKKAANYAPDTTTTPIFNSWDNSLAESGSSSGSIYGVLQTKQALHGTDPSNSTLALHAEDDTGPVHVYANTGDISGLTLYTPKAAEVVAGQDITDVGLYLQNVNSSDISVVSAGRNIVLYDRSSDLYLNAKNHNTFNNYDSSPLNSGDVQVSGPGSLEVLAGQNLQLGVAANNSDGTGLGITSIGGARNPVLLSQTGAQIVAAAGLGPQAGSLDATKVDFPAFINQFINPNTSGGYSSTYLPELATLMTEQDLLQPGEDPWTTFNDPTKVDAEHRDQLALDIFYLVLRDAGRAHNVPSKTSSGYATGFDAIYALFTEKAAGHGNIDTTSREIKTINGGGINLLLPGGGLTLGKNPTNPASAQGIVTQAGGDINIFAHNNVDIGDERIFTLKGGNIVIWSSTGNIAAGSSSKTVQSAPPTQVLVDPQSGNVELDLSGLSTGGGIGTLQPFGVAQVTPSSIDLIAPAGVVDAGDAGIRATGNLNIAAVQILNASNISVSGSSTGVPTVSTPNIGSLTSAPNNNAANNAGQQAAQEAAKRTQDNSNSLADLDSDFSVEVLGYGGE